MSTESQFPDKTGRPLKPGDLVIYGHALGRCAGLQYGKVLAVTEGKFGYDQVFPKLRVQGGSMDDNNDFHDPEWTATRRTKHGDPLVSLLKPSTLSFPSRVLRVTREQVPAAVLKALETPK